MSQQLEQHENEKQLRQKTYKSLKKKMETNKVVLEQQITKIDGEIDRVKGEIDRLDGYKTKYKNEIVEIDQILKELDGVIE